jgi:hypothetical protein
MIHIGLFFTGHRRLSFAGFCRFPLGTLDRRHAKPLGDSLSGNHNRTFCAMRNDVSWTPKTRDMIATCQVHTAFEESDRKESDRNDFADSPESIGGYRLSLFSMASAISLGSRFGTIRATC